MTRPLIGLDMFYYAIMTQDDSSAVTYNAVVRVNNAVSLSVNPNSQIMPFFADDGPREVFSQVGEVDVSIMVADLPPADYAALVGATYHTGTGVIDYPVSASAPDVAIGFRAKKTNGAYRYVWLLKGKFGVPNMEHQTQEGSVNFQSQTINGKFMARTKDNMVFKRADSDDTNVSMTLPADWFAGPDLVAPPAAITMDSTLPADGADDVDRTDPFIWTFSDPVLATFATDTYFGVYSSGSVAVAGSVNYTSTATDQVKFIPTSTAGWGEDTKYIAIAKAGVRGSTSSPMAADFIVSFTSTST